jgi:hypothetical protein
LPSGTFSIGEPALAGIAATQRAAASQIGRITERMILDMPEI